MNQFNIKSAMQQVLLTLLLIASAQFTSASEHVTYYVNDALGSPIMALDEVGAVVWQESYQPYGQRQNKPAAAQYDEQFYTGKQEEPDIGLQYYGARWYDPESGRFTSIDPVGMQEGNVHSFNRYAYANNNPYKYVDPNGDSPLDIGFFAVDALSFGIAVASGNPAAMGSAGLDLTMSAIGLISPIPGTGQVLKFARVADKFGDAAKVTTGGDNFVDGYRAVSKAEADDIAKHGFRPDPSGRSMQDKWFSETREGAEKFRQNYSDLDNVVNAKVPKDVYDRSYKHSNIDNTGSGFCVACDDLSRLKVGQ